MDKNFRGPQGEIDLIMRDAEFYVFVEVRLRSSAEYGGSLESVSAAKQRCITKTALYYLQKYDLLEKAYSRFDVLGVNKQQDFIWIKNAFEVQY